MQKKTKKITTITSIFIVTMAMVFSLPGNGGNRVLAATGDGNMTGYIWSENIDWINTYTSGSYQVSVSNTDGALSGFAWGSFTGTDGMGWVDFAPTGTPPVSAYNSGPAKIDLSTGVVSGWARIVSLKNEYGTTSPDIGWISLKGNGYGLVFDMATGKIKGNLDPVNSASYIANPNPNRWAWAGDSGDSAAGTHDGIGWLDFAGVTLQNVVQRVASNLNFNVNVVRGGQDISKGPGQKITITPSGSNTYDICTDPSTCTNPVRVGDIVNVTMYLVDQFGSLYFHSTYSSDCKITIVDPVTKESNVSVCKNTADLPDSGISGTFALNLNQSGTIELTVKGTPLQGTVQTTTIRIKVPAIKALQ